MRKKILIAEDDETNYKLVNIILTKSNVDTLWAKNGKEAVELYEQHPDINLILMDIKMPIMNGSTAAKKIKEINQNVPIIGLSAYHDLQDEINLDAYLQKPFIGKDLLSMIDKHVKNLCTEMLEREEKRAKEWKENEEEALKVLNGLSKVLELTDSISVSESTKVLIELEEIKNILKKKCENNSLNIVFPDIK